MITSMLRRNLAVKSVSRVIVETEQSEFENILNEIEAVHPLYQKIKRFNMVSFSAPSIMIEAVGDLTGVKTIFQDKINNILPVGGRLSGLLRDRTSPSEYTLPTSETRKLLEVPIAEAEGINGAETTIAVLDSGAYALPTMGFGIITGRFSHPQFRTRNVKVFNANIGNVGEGFGINDKCGHGTQVITILAGEKHIYRNNLECQGMSLGSNLIAVKCLYGRIGSGRDSDVIAALAIAEEQGANIINMSLGSEVDFDTYTWKEDAICQVIEELHNKDILVCCAIGNSGEGGYRTVNSPATSPHAIAVGAYSHIYKDVAYFSSRGESPDGFTRPICISYGGGAPTPHDEQEVIFSGTMPGSVMDIPDGIDGAAGLMGSSQATPHFAGLLSLWYQYLKKNLGKYCTYNDVIKILKTNGNPTPDDTEGYGLPTYSWVKNY